MAITNGDGILRRFFPIDCYRKNHKQTDYTNNHSCNLSSFRNLLFTSFTTIRAKIAIINCTAFRTFSFNFKLPPKNKKCAALKLHTEKCTLQNCCNTSLNISTHKHKENRRIFTKLKCAVCRNNIHF